VVPGRDEQQRRGVGPDPVEGEQAGGAGSDQRDDELAEALELAAGNTARRPSSRSAMRVA